MEPPLPLRIVHGLTKISLALKAGGFSAASQAGLSPTQAQILVLLATSPPARLSELAGRLAITPATASDAVRALAAKGLLRRDADPSDGRALALAPTARGRRLAGQLAHWPDFLAGAVEALASAEQVVFHRALIKMIRALQENGRIPAARMCVNCVYFRPNVHSNAAAPHHCDYVDAPFGDGDLRIDCPDFSPAAGDSAWRTWVSLPAIAGGPAFVSLRKE
jgi:DNA-binding MarR family transcriptional regulator